MIKMYESYRKDGKLPATYEVIYGHAWKRTSNLGAIEIIIAKKIATLKSLS